MPETQERDLAIEFPRQFLAQDVVLDSWDKIEPYFVKLQACSIATTGELEQWLVDYSELVAAIDEVGTDRHVKMTCQTDDASRKAAFLDFIENIDPKTKPAAHALNVKYADCAKTLDLPHERYHVLDRSIRASVDVFREGNVALQTEEAKLSQAYQEICGAQMVEFDGEEKTLQQLAPYAESTDREVRESAWVVEVERRSRDTAALNEIFGKMVKLRHKMALNAGCHDYVELAFKEKQRFDYTPKDCRDFHDAVEKAVVPAMRALQSQRKESLGVESLRPWDSSVDIHGRPPLKPFDSPDELCDKASNVFRLVDPELRSQFDEMRSLGYLDLESRKGKAPGGYQATYDESRHPFIFMNAVGVQSDVRTLIHEGGHAFHSYAARHDALLPYRGSPIEFAEVASFGMELLSLDYLGEFYEGDDFARAKRSQLEGILGLFPWVAMIDAFQHFLYANPEHSDDDRQRAWLELFNRFGGMADYTGFEQAKAYSWHKQLHLFEVPFYYVEYGIAKLGAMQVWRNSKKDYRGAVKDYRKALALGGSKPLPVLFETAGAKFDFSYDTIAPLVELAQDELSKLPL